MNTIITEDKFFDQSRSRIINEGILILGHSDVERNESADQEAKKAVKSI